MNNNSIHYFMVQIYDDNDNNNVIKHIITII